MTVPKQTLGWTKKIFQLFKHSSDKQRNAYFFIAGALFLGIAVYFYKNALIEAWETLHQLFDKNTFRYGLVFFVFFTAAQILRGMRTLIFADLIIRKNFIAAYKANVFAMLVGLITPGRSGEVTRIIWLTTRINNGVKSSLLFLIEKIQDLVSLAFSFIILFCLSNSFYFSFFIALFCFLTIFFLPLFLFTQRQEPSKRNTQTYAPQLEISGQSSLVNRLTKIGRRAKLSFRAYLFGSLLSLCILICNILSFFQIVVMMGFNDPLLIASASQLGANLGVALGLTPLGLGTYQFAGAFLVEFSGSTMSLGIALLALTHGLAVVSLFVNVMLAYLAGYWEIKSKFQ